MKEVIEMMDGMDMGPEDFDKMQNMVVCGGKLHNNRRRMIF